MSVTVEKLRAVIESRKQERSRSPNRIALPCVQEGQLLERCHSCPATAEGKHVRECEVHTKCTYEEVSSRVMNCRYCKTHNLGYAPERKPLPAGALSPLSSAQRLAYWDHESLSPLEGGKRFNASVIEYQNRLLLAYRDGWAGSEVHLVRLSADFRPVGESVTLPLTTEQSKWGREDPRLFLHKGRLHLSFIGVVGTSRRLVRTNQLYCRLSEDGFGVEEVFAPRLEGRRGWEKNWQFFDHNGHLLSVYTPSPHQVLRIEGNRAERVGLAHPFGHWQGGEPRGSTPPVRVGDEYWSFFHDRISDGDGLQIYRAGLYTFSATDFRPLRYTPQPVLVADRKTKPTDQYAAVCFPCGSIHRGDHWLLSTGAHDRWTELWRFAHAELEQALRPI